MVEMNAIVVRLVNMRLRLAANALRYQLKANFNPAQPRVPAGGPDGGQWTDGDGAIGSTGRIVLVAGPDMVPRIDLNQEEGYNGAHTLKFHSGKKAEELIERMGPPARRWQIASYTMYRNGSFDSEKDANYYVNDVLSSNSDIVRQVASGKLEDSFIIKRWA